MVEYKCKKCNKVFNHLGNYNSHLSRIFPCTDVKEEKKENNSQQKNDDKNDMACRYCNKVFSRKDVCHRHEKTNCKSKKLFENNEEEIKKSTVINNFQTVNNFQTINNIQQNFGYNPSQNINPFGKEDVSFLTHGIMKNILKNPDNGIPQLIRLIHFNPEVPQNQNVRLKNKKEPYLNVFNGQHWELRDKDDTIQDLIISKKEIADDYLDNLLLTENVDIIEKQDKIINALTQKKYETYTEAIDEYLNTIILDDNDSKRIIMNKYKRLYDKLYKQINLILMNNTQLASHYEKNLLSSTSEP